MRYQFAIASPVPRLTCAPTIPCPPKNRFSLLNMCIDPPFPFEYPVARPVSSAITPRGSIPVASMCP